MLDCEHMTITNETMTFMVKMLSFQTLWCSWGSFNNYVQNMRDESVQKCLFLFMLRVKTVDAGVRSKFLGIIWNRQLKFFTIYDFWVNVGKTTEIINPADTPSWITDLTYSSKIHDMKGCAIFEQFIAKKGPFWDYHIYIYA